LDKPVIIQKRWYNKVYSCEDKSLSFYADFRRKPSQRCNCGNCSKPQEYRKGVEKHLSDPWGPEKTHIYR